jgi:hypothetical protein
MTTSGAQQGIRPGVCLSTSRPASPYIGQIVYMTDVNQSAVWNGTSWVGLTPTGGRNQIINGDFKIWQRGTSYTIARGNYGAADRYVYWHNGSTDGTNTVSRQNTTPGAAPVAGYESQFFQRITTTTLGTGQGVIDTWQRIEDVRTLAGQTATFSFWAKTSGNFNVTGIIVQNFGSGGSADVDTTIIANTATSSAWTRYTGTVTLPSISGKTIGTSSFVFAIIRFISPTAGATFDIWGVQLEAGAVATPFEVEDIGETLRKCQRYYWRTGGTPFGPLAIANTHSTTTGRVYIKLPVSMRIPPTSLTISGTAPNTGSGTYSSLVFDRSTSDVVMGGLTGTGYIAGGAQMIFGASDATTFLEVNAEL